MNVSTYLNVRDRLGRVTGRRLVGAEVVKANCRTAWVDIGGSVIKRKLRRDFSKDDTARLVGARATAHLDDETLTALTEGRLDRRERRRAISHLADCADCRELLALSLDTLAEGPQP